MSDPTETDSPEERRAKDWTDYILRGASGRGPVGTESSGEHLVVMAAGACLPDGVPVLSLLYRFSIDELADIQRALDMIGHCGWYYPVKARQDPNVDGEPEAHRILGLLSGRLPAHSVPGSTSELITVFLATGRYEDLPELYRRPADAWERLDQRQRRIVRAFNPVYRDRRWQRPERQS